MTTPRVTEIPLRLTPVDRDPFADALPAALRSRDERRTRERRVELVRSVMRDRADARAPEGGRGGRLRAA